MIALKALLAGIGLSVFGTVAYLVLYFWQISRIMRRTSTGTGQVGWDLVSMAHNTIFTSAYWLLVVGLFATGMAIVFLWPRPVIVP